MERTLSWGIGLAVELFALALVPLVLARRKDPASTAAWILALVFLPGLGASLFLLFGRDRVRLPVKWKLDADERLAIAGRRHVGRVPTHARERAIAHIASPIDRDLFRVSAALAGGEPLPGNEVIILVDGDATYEAIGDAIDRAERRVLAEYYLLRDDATALWFRDKLAAAARRGVEVKLLMDGYGSFWISRRWMKALRDAGAEVAVFLPARLFFLQPMNLRNHRKIVVVDDDIAFTGGINVGDEYRGEKGPWRDTHLRVTGPAAAGLRRIFEEDWYFATRHALPSPRASHPPSEAPARRSFGDAMVSIIKSGPDVAGPMRETIHRVFFSAITGARERVLITTPYFIPDPAMVVALQTAALRGVDVRLLFPSKSNHPFVFQAGRSFYQELLDAGVSIYEYGPGMIHAKTMVVDGTVALAGSANMDLRSFRLNFEVHAVIRDDKTARDMEARFYEDLAVSSKLDAEAFRARPWYLHVIEGAARLASPLM